MPSAPVHPEGPFHGRITFEDVAARVEAHALGDDPATMRTQFARLLRSEGAGDVPLERFGPLEAMRGW